MPAEPRSRDRFQLWELLVLVAGASVGLAIFFQKRENAERLGMCLLGIFGGIAFVGPLILLNRRRKAKRPFGPGELLWFTQGTAAWLLWPPIIYNRWRDRSQMGPGGNTEVCFAYGTPLMALFLVVSLIAGDLIRINPRRRRRRPRPWTEWFGLLLGLGWACTGAYLLAMFWGEDLK